LATTAGLAAFNALTIVGLTAQDILVAAYFGTREVVGAFVLAHAVPKQVFTIVVGSIVAAFVPAFVAVRDQDGLIAAQRLMKSVTGASVGLLALVAIGLGIVAPPALTHLLPTSDSDTVSAFTRLFYLLLPSILIHGVANIWLGGINASGRLHAASIATALIPGLAIASLLLFGNAFGIYALAWGTLAGYAVQLASIGIVLRLQRFPLMPLPVAYASQLRAILRQSALLLGGTGLLSAGTLVDQAFAATLGPQAIATLSYGTKISTVVTAVANASLGTASLPYFAVLAARSDFASVGRSVRAMSVLVLLVTVPVALLLSVGSPAVVALAFERGAFTGSDTEAVAAIQRMHAPYLVPFVISVVFMRALSSIGNNRAVVAAATISFAVNIVSDYVLIRLWGLSGIAFATVLTYTVFASGLGVALLNRLTRQRFFDPPGHENTTQPGSVPR
jgi:putative peptidoglycan lipid II flippase